MESEFYRNGLRFSCVRCSRCCRHEPGYVFLSMDDLKEIARFLGLDISETVDRYCREVHINGFRRLSLKEKPNFDCIFWENGGCSIYRARPIQCRTYPFWEEYLGDEETWRSLELSCPGVNKGRLYTFEEIEELRRIRREHPPIVL